MQLAGGKAAQNIVFYHLKRSILIHYSNSSIASMASCALAAQELTNVFQMYKETV